MWGKLRLLLMLWCGAYLVACGTAAEVASPSSASPSKTTTPAKTVDQYSATRDAIQRFVADNTAADFAEKNKRLASGLGFTDDPKLVDSQIGLSVSLAKTIESADASLIYQFTNGVHLVRGAHLVPNGDTWTVLPPSATSIVSAPAKDYLSMAPIAVGESRAIRVKLYELEHRHGGKNGFGQPFSEARFKIAITNTISEVVQLNQMDFAVLRDNDAMWADQIFPALFTGVDGGSVKAIALNDEDMHRFGIGQIERGGPGFLLIRLNPGYTQTFMATIPYQSDFSGGNIRIAGTLFPLPE